MAFGLPLVLRFLPDWAVALLGIDYAATISIHAGFPGTLIERLDESHVEMRHLEGLDLLVEHDAQSRMTSPGPVSISWSQ